MDGEYMAFILLLFIILYKFDIFFEWDNKGNSMQKLWSRNELEVFKKQEED